MSGSFRENGNRANEYCKKEGNESQNQKGGPKHSFTEILTEILIVLNEELMEISACENTREQNKGQNNNMY